MDEFWRSASGRNRTAWLLPALLLLTACASAQVAPYRPVDEAKKDPTLVAFRTRLVKALQARDSRALGLLVAPNAKIGDGRKGPQAFLEDFQHRADHFLSGGKFDGKNAFVGPSIYVQWPDKYDAIDYVAIPRAQVPVYQSPSTASKKVGSVAFCIVECTDEQEGWLRIALRGGAEGYVQAKHVDRPLAGTYRFERTKSGWRVASASGGD